jgi:hypothetical protein
MTQTSIQNRVFWISALVLSAAYLGAACLYFKERICFADTAHMLVKIINREGFNIEAGRYPQVLTQIPVLLAIKLKLAPAAIAAVYSVSFPLLYFSLATIANRFYRFRYAFHLLIFSLSGAVSLGFFHAGTETHQVIAWGILFLAWILSYNRMGDNKYLIGFSMAGIAITAFTLHAHPVGLFFVLFGIFVRLATGEKPFELPPLLATILAILLTALKLANTSEGSYDAAFLSQIPEFPKLFANIGSNWSLHYFAERLGQVYVLLPIAVIVAGIWLAINKLYKLLILHLVFNVFFFLFTILIYHQGDSDLMMQRAFMPFAFFSLAAAFAGGARKVQLKLNTTFSLFVTAITLVALTGIFRYGTFMSERLSYMQQTHIKHQSSGRVFLSLNEIDQKFVPIPWSYSLETLIYSSIQTNGKDCFSIITTDYEGLVFAQPERPEVFMTNNSYGRILFEELNPRYFNLNKAVYISPALQADTTSQVPEDEPGR